MSASHSPSRDTCLSLACLRLAFAGAMALAFAVLLVPSAGADGASGDGEGAREAEAARKLNDFRARKLVDRGRQLLRSGTYAEARDAFREAVRLSPEDAAAKELLARAEKVLGTSSAVADVRRRRAEQTKALVRQANLELFQAKKALESGDHATAATHAERVLANARYIDGATEATGLVNRARKVLEAARQDGAKAAAESRRGRLAQAKAAADAERAQAARANAARLRSLRAQAETHLDANRLDEASTVADRMLERDPADPHALFVQDEVRRRRAETPSLRGTPAERRRAEDDLLLQTLREQKLPEKGRIVLPARAERSIRRASAKPIEAWEADIRRRLEEPVTLEFEGTPLEDAVASISAVSGVSIIIDPDVKNRRTPVTITRASARMPLGSLLRWVAHFGRLDYVLRDGAILLTTPTGKLRGPLRRVYDIGSFLASAEDAQGLAFDGPVEPLAHPRAYEKEAAADPETIGKGWVDFIRTTIAPSTWYAEGKSQVLQERQPYTIAYRNGRIVVVHTPEVHDQIAELLDNFREARNLQVHIQARFIELTKAALDTLSVEAAFDTIQQDLSEPVDIRRYRATGSITHDPNVSDLARLTGFSNTGGVDVVYTYDGDDFLQLSLSSVLKERKRSILNAPRITCFNTQRANLQVLTNHNYVRRVTTDNEPEIGNIPEGIVFDVQPFVSADRRYITLVLQPQMRELVELIEFMYSTEPQTIDQGDDTLAVFQESYIQIPTTRLRSLGTTVTVPNGGTLLLGGFAEVEENAGQAGLPFIDGIPILRSILRGWDRNEGRRSLIMLVTAQTVPDIFEE